MSQITIFYHIAKINNWQFIKNEHEDLLEKISECRIIENHLEQEDLKKYEVPTLNMLWEHCQSAPEHEIVGYIHSKGVTKPKDKISRLWRETLNYWVLDRWQDHVKALKKYDVSGVRLYNYEIKGKALPHFSGNFWFAKCGYIKKLVSPEVYVQTYEPKHQSKAHGPERFGCEFWIGSGDGYLNSINNDDTIEIKKGHLHKRKGLHSFRYWKNNFG